LRNAGETSRSRQTLLQDPDDAHARRGAHDTFDAASFVDFVTSLKSTAVVRAPTFSHAIKDPVPAALAIQPHHRIVILEGLYVALALEPWRRGGEALDEVWLVEADEDVAKARIVERHVAAGIVDTKEAAVLRADLNDLPSE
jgi:pantothenate kinase